MALTFVVTLLLFLKVVIGVDVHGQCSPPSSKPSVSAFSEAHCGKLTLKVNKVINATCKV